MVRYSRKEYKFVKFEKSTNPEKNMMLYWKTNQLDDKCVLDLVIRIYLNSKILLVSVYTAKKTQTTKTREDNLEQDLVLQNRNKISKITTHRCILVGRNYGENYKSSISISSS